MAAISVETIRTLASFKSTDRPVVSVYLDVDGKRWPRFVECEARLERLLRDAIERGDGAAGDDLRRIASAVKGGIDRSHTRGVAFFACGDQLWESYQLPVAVRDQVVVNQTPHVSQLEAVLDSHQRFGVLLADRQRARMLVFELGQLVEQSELFDRLPRGDDEPGDRDRGGNDHHLDAVTHHHLKRAARVAFEVFKQREYDHLLVGSPPDIAGELERLLHSYLRSRIAARISVPVAASDAEIAAAAIEVEAAIDRDRQAGLVARLRAAAASGRGGVVGLDAVLAALAERRVDVLVVSNGFEREGWRCPACERLAVLGRRCPQCGESMRAVEDVVGECIDDAVLQSCRIEVCTGNADLDVLGRAGALLRF